MQGERAISYLTIGEDLKYFGFTKNFIPEGLGISLQNGIPKNIGNFKVIVLSFRVEERNRTLSMLFVFKNTNRDLFCKGWEKCTAKTD